MGGFLDAIRLALGWLYGTVSAPSPVEPSSTVIYGRAAEIPVVYGRAASTPTIYGAATPAPLLYGRDDVAIEAAINNVHAYEDFAFPWEHADQEDISSYDLIFEMMASYTATPVVTRTVGSGIVLAGTPNYRATITLSSANLGRTPGQYVYTISKRNSGAKRVLTYGPIPLLAPRVGRD